MLSEAKRVLNGFSNGNERIPGLGDRDFIYTKNSGAARAIYLRNPIRKRHLFQKIVPLRGQFIHWILSTQRIPGGDLVENGCFIEVKLANVCRFSDFARGTMREKMAIFKERNRSWQGSKIFNGGDVDENRHFIEGKVGAHYQKLNILNGGDGMKIVILLRESWSHITKN